MRRGRRKIWGTVPDEVFAELERFRLAEGLPNLSKAAGLAVEQWAAKRRGGVQNARDDPEGSV